MKTLLAILLIGLSTPVFAGSVCDHLPPMQYRFQPNPLPTYIEVNKAGLREACAPSNARYACAYKEQRVIYILKRSILRQSGMDDTRMACLRKHEEGHINGWAANHE